MKCAACGGEVAKLSMENADGVKGYLYYCNACHRNFWKAPDGTIVDYPCILSIDINEKFRRELEKYKNKKNNN